MLPTVRFLTSSGVVLQVIGDAIRTVSVLRHRFLCSKGAYLIVNSTKLGSG